MTEETLEVSLSNELREIAGVAAQIDEFCAAHESDAGGVLCAEFVH